MKAEEGTGGRDAGSTQGCLSGDDCNGMRGLLSRKAPPMPVWAPQCPAYGNRGPRLTSLAILQEQGQRLLVVVVPVPEVPLVFLD